MAAVPWRRLVVHDGVCDLQQHLAHMPVTPPAVEPLHQRLRHALSAPIDVEHCKQRPCFRCHRALALVQCRYLPAATAHAVVMLIMFPACVRVGQTGAPRLMDGGASGKGPHKVGDLVLGQAPQHPSCRPCRCVVVPPLLLLVRCCFLLVLWLRVLRDLLKVPNVVRCFLVGKRNPVCSVALFSTSITPARSCSRGSRGDASGGAGELGLAVLSREAGEDGGEEAEVEGVHVMLHVEEGKLPPAEEACGVAGVAGEVLCGEVHHHHKHLARSSFSPCCCCSGCCSGCCCSSSSLVDPGLCCVEHVAE
mmetsp:Transcript_10464/g.20955  ORF Transcript_10464/g.20955 Transcript_10464/m.20955 type:complete len:307 (+) Transcript_10464:613-1533(+)